MRTPAKVGLTCCSCSGIRQTRQFLIGDVQFLIPHSQPPGSDGRSMPRKSLNHEPLDGLGVRSWNRHVRCYKSGRTWHGDRVALPQKLLRKNPTWAVTVVPKGVGDTVVSALRRCPVRSRLRHSAPTISCWKPLHNCFGFAALAKPISSKTHPAEQLEQLRQEESQWSCYWHQSFRLSPSSLMVCQRAKRHRLNETEREILAALVLDQLAMLPARISTSADVLQLVTRPGKRMLHAVRTLSEHGRLHAAGLISFDDPDEDLPQRKPVVDPALVDSVLSRRGQTETVWRVSSEAELLDRMQMLTRTLMRQERHDAARGPGLRQRRRGVQADSQGRAVAAEAGETLDRHPGWKLGEIRKECCLPPEQTMFMALVGKRLGHLQASETLFTGGGLARAASDSADSVAENLRLLMADCDLVRKGFVRPCGGDAEVASNDAGELEQTEFELTEKAVCLLGIEKRAAKGRFGEFVARKPTVRLDQLVLLGPGAQGPGHGDGSCPAWGAAHGRLGAWAKLIPYGRGPVLLFSGPPGTGKTATAEALGPRTRTSRSWWPTTPASRTASSGRRRRTSCGRSARRRTRRRCSSGTRPTPCSTTAIRPTATGRSAMSTCCCRSWSGSRDLHPGHQPQDHLDKALQRRITLKVEFHRPDRPQRREIWEKFLPRKLPLARDVDLDRLCANRPQRRRDQERGAQRRTTGVAAQRAGPGHDAGFPRGRRDGTKGRLERPRPEPDRVRLRLPIIAARRRQSARRPGRIRI